MANVQELSTKSLVKLCSFLFWCGLYIHSMATSPSKEPEWGSRLITLLHGSVASIVGLSQCGIMSLTTERLKMKVSPRQHALMFWSWGYFAFDLLWCLIHDSDNWVILCHHLCSIMAITIYIGKEYSGCTFACNLAMMEITNPLLQTRWFLKHEGYEKTTMFQIVDATYVVLFFLIRGLFGTFLLNHILHSQIFEWDEKVISLLFYFISLALMYNVMGYVLHRYQSKIGTRLRDLQKYVLWTRDSSLNHA